MSGKPRCHEAIKRLARQDPDGMVKATQLEPKYPSCKSNDLDTMADIQDSLNRGSSRRPRKMDDHDGPGSSNTLHGSRVPLRNSKGTKRAPTTILNVTHVRNAGLPTGREPYGNGATTVVRGGESPPHGEGWQVRQMTTCGGTRNAQC